MLKTNKSNICLDVLKFLCAVLIVGSHCLPVSRNEMLNLYYGQWFFRFCVPLFFISSGYFFFRMDTEKKKEYVKRIFYLYVIATALYSPFIASTVLNKKFGMAIKQLLLGYSHLWYLSALFAGLLFLYFLDKKNVFSKINRKTQCAVITALLLFGAFFDEYYKLVDVPAITAAGALIEKLGGIRHAPFFAVPMLLVGKTIAESNITSQQHKAKCVAFLVGAGVLSLVEFLFLKQHFGTALKCDLTLFNWLPAVPLFLLSFYVHIPVGPQMSRLLRKMADVVYIIHPWIIFLLRKLQVTYWAGFICATVISIALSVIIVRIKKPLLRKFSKE